jgi:hypothetical protein
MDSISSCFSCMVWYNSWPLGLIKWEPQYWCFVLMVSSVCDVLVVWDIYIVLFHKMGFGCLFSGCWEILLHLLCVGSARLHSTLLCSIPWINLLICYVRWWGDSWACSFVQLFWTRLFRTFWRTLTLFWLVYVFVCLLWLMAFWYYFSLLGCMSFSFVLQISVVLQGFRPLVPVYL